MDGTGWVISVDMLVATSGLIPNTKDMIYQVLWIRIRMDCLDPDPELLFRIRIQLNMKEQISKNVISL